MPREADHEQRRRQIAEAVWRLASRGGLEGVTLRQVAAEAGVSLRLVQYYFGTRQQLLLGALQILNADAERAAGERIATLGPAPASRELIRVVLHELLPLDEERQARHLMYVVFFVRFLTDPELQSVAQPTGPTVEDLIARLIRSAQQAGELPTAVVADREAILLVSATIGMQASALLGHLAIADAMSLVDELLDRLYSPGSAGSPGPGTT